MNTLKGELDQPRFGPVARFVSAITIGFFYLMIITSIFTGMIVPVEMIRDGDTKTALSVLAVYGVVVGIVASFYLTRLWFRRYPRPARGDKGEVVIEPQRDDLGRPCGITKEYLEQEIKKGAGSKLDWGREVWEAHDRYWPNGRKPPPNPIIEGLKNVAHWALVGLLLLFAVLVTALAIVLIAPLFANVTTGNKTSDWLILVIIWAALYIGHCIRDYGAG